MHSIRSKARHLAWRVDGDKDGIARFIPFAGRNGPSRSNTLQDVESGRGDQRPHRDRTHSETCLDSDQQIRQREEQQHGLTKRAQTVPYTPIQEISPTSHASSDERWPVPNGSGGTVDSTPPTDESFVKQSRSESDSTAVQRRRKSRWLSKILPRKNKSENSAKDGGERKGQNKRFAETDAQITIANQIRVVLLGSWVNILLVCVPVGIALQATHQNGYAVFVVNFIAIIPLAGMLSYATEEIAMRVGETLGGLLNASFGNAVELIVSIIALAQDEILIVKTSLIGSMLSNLLLVMGMCFFFGGLGKLEQYFNVTVAQTASSLLALAVGSLLIPTFFDQGSNNSGSPELRASKVPALSRGVAVILLVVYLCYLTFQLKTHAKIFAEAGGDARVDEDKIKKKSSVETMGIRGALASSGAGAAAATGGAVNEKKTASATADVQQEEEEVPKLTMLGAIVTLCVATAFVGVNAEYMVDGISYVVQHGNVSPEFIGLILVPIVGNAAEHATAVTVAIKDKMDLAIGVAVGSSLQIALFVLPVTVIIGWIIGAFPHAAGYEVMTLEFDVFQIGLLFVAIILVNYLIQDGASHWLEGVLLMSTYVMIAVAAWFYPASADVVG